MTDQRENEILLKCIDYIDKSTNKDDLYIVLTQKIGLTEEEIKEFDLSDCIPPETLEDEDNDSGYSLYEEERREYYRNVEAPQIAGMNRR